MEYFSIPISTRICDDVIERVLSVLRVMITSGVSPTDPQCATLSVRADTNTQVVQRRTRITGLVHNHPSGDPKPSAADLAITREIVAAAEAISVRVHDHLVIGRDGVSSFKTLGLL
jgi:proteasome lid subunit RPN8/RPN11